MFHVNKLTLSQLSDLALRVGSKGAGTPIKTWLRFRAVYDRLNYAWQRKYESELKGIRNGTQQA